MATANPSIRDQRRAWSAVIRRRTPGLLALGAAISAAVLGQGCILGLSAATVATVAAGAAGEGYSAWRGSRLVYVDETRSLQMSRAVDVTLERLDLEVREREAVFSSPTVLQGRSWKVASERGHLAWIRLRELTPSMARVEVDIGMFGDRAVAELIVTRIKEELMLIEAQDAGAEGV